MTLLLLTAALVATGSPVVERAPPDREPSTMTSTEIRTFNTGLDKRHPQFIHCEKTEVIGSLARKLRVCRTNVEWARASDAGNDNAREIADAMRRAPVSGQ